MASKIDDHHKGTNNAISALIEVLSEELKDVKLMGAAEDNMEVLDKALHKAEQYHDLADKLAKTYAKFLTELVEKIKNSNSSVIASHLSKIREHILFDTKEMNLIVPIIENRIEKFLEIDKLHNAIKWDKIESIMKLVNLPEINKQEKAVKDHKAFLDGAIENKITHLKEYMNNETTNFKGLTAWSLVIRRIEEKNNTYKAQMAEIVIGINRFVDGVSGADKLREEIVIPLETFISEFSKFQEEILFINDTLLPEEPFLHDLRRKIDHEKFAILDLLKMLPKI